MSEIWKYELKNGIIEMPKGAEIIALRMQLGKLCIWAIVNPEAETESREFEIIYTGQSFDSMGKVYIGTILTDNDLIVLHIFDKQPF